MTKSRLHRVSAQRVWVALCLLLLTGALCCRASAGFFGVEEEDNKKKVAEDAPAALHRALSEAWNAYYTGDYRTAVAKAAPLASNLGGANVPGLSDLAIKKIEVEAKHLMARAYWSYGGEKARAQAVQIWAQLESAKGLSANEERGVVAQAMQLARQGEDDEALSLLEGVLKRGWSDTCTPEAAIEMARLQAEAGRLDEAKRALDFVERFLKHEMKREIDPVRAEPFIAAAHRMRADLKRDADAGRVLFEKAQALRRASRFTEAAQTYRAVQQQFAKSDYATRSELHIGHCLLGVGRVDLALKHWEDFIAKAPSGPWRGQAYVAMVDVYLEERLDPDSAGRYMANARPSLDEHRKGRGASPSWDAAAVDLHVRRGILATLQGASADAAHAFEEARRSLDPKAGSRRPEGLRRLVLCAEEGATTVPQEVRAAGADAKASVVLHAGVVYNAVGDYEHAERVFGRAVSRRWTGPGAAHAAFAQYGKAVALEAQKKHREARNAYEESLRRTEGASWQDEALYRLAMLIERQAAAKFDQKAVAEGHKADPKKAPSTDTSGPEAPDTSANLRLVKARRDALPYWEKLISKHAKSPRVETALFHAGVIYAESDRCPEAVKALGTLVRGFPESRWTPEARIRLVDINLERLFDLAAAREHVRAGVAWASEAEATSARGAADVLPIWAEPVGLNPINKKRLDTIKYQLFVRAGVVAYLEQHFEEAKAMFEAAEPLTPPQDFVVVRGHIPTPVERMIEAAKERKTLTPQEALLGDSKANLMLQLAGIYNGSGEYEKAIELCARVISAQGVSPTPLQRSWAHHCKADAVYRQSDCQDAKPDYLAAVKACPDAPWAPRSLFYVGTITNNFGQDQLGAADIFQEVVRRYPKSDVADKAAYFAGIMYEYTKQWTKAKVAYEQLLKQYPQSKWRDLVERTHMKHVAKELATAVQGTTKGGTP